MIRTGRLILRDWRDEDIEPFIHHTNTEPVMRWLGGMQPEAKQRDTIVNRIMRWQRERGFTFWVVEREEDGELLGFCGIKLVEPSRARILASTRSAGGCARTRGGRAMRRKPLGLARFRLRDARARSGSWPSPASRTNRAGV